MPPMDFHSSTSTNNDDTSRTMQAQLEAIHSGDVIDYEESLESQRIVELQAFIERRVWIEEKIQVGHILS